MKNTSYRSKIIIFLLSLSICTLVIFGIVKWNNEANKSVSGASMKTTAVVDTALIKPDADLKKQDDIFDINAYKDKLTIWFFNIDEQGRPDIHSGDSMLLRTPDNITMLIDSGLPESSQKILGYIKKLGITKLDIAVATHMHIDHIGGFDTILGNIPVDKVILSDYTNYNSSNAKDFLSDLQAKNIKLNYVKAGDKFSIGKDITAEIFNPEESDGKIPDNDTSAFLNNQSIVMKLTYKNNTFLFAGDVQKETEANLISKYGSKLDSDLLKVPHHGSTTSSTTDFISAVSPKISVMTFYALESMPIYEKYQKKGSKVFLTGIDGIIRATSDGNEIIITTEKERRGTLKP